MSTISCANQGHCSKGLDALRDNQRVQGCAPWWTYPFLCPLCFSLDAVLWLKGQLPGEIPDN